MLLEHTVKFKKSEFHIEKTTTKCNDAKTARLTKEIPFHLQSGLANWNKECLLEFMKKIHVRIKALLSYCEMILIHNSRNLGLLVLWLNYDATQEDNIKLLIFKEGKHFDGLTIFSF